MTKEYRTVSSMLLIFRWRTSNESLSKTLIIFAVWPGIRREMIFKTTLDPEILASISASGELQHAPSSLTCSNPKTLLLWSTWQVGCSSTSGLGLGPGLGLTLFLLFFDSKDWRTWCSSFIKSITPPIIDAWSPYKHHIIYTMRKRRKRNPKCRKS